MICAIISIIATLMLPDYTNKEISTEAEYEAASGGPATVGARATS